MGGTSSSNDYLEYLFRKSNYKKEKNIRVCQNQPLSISIGGWKQEYI